MEIQFIFRGKLYFCIALIDYSEYPCYVFIILKDIELAKEFGEEVTIKNDFVKVMARKDDYPELIELRQAIFSAVKSKPAFMFISEQYKRSGKVGANTANNNKN